MARGRRKKLNRTLITVFCLIGCLVSVLSLISSLAPVISMKNEISILEIQKQLVQSEKDTLEEEIELLNNEDYITRYARENYVFTRDGEQVTIIPNNE